MERIDGDGERGTIDQIDSLYVVDLVLARCT